jgi:hypothetical protein
MTLFYCQKICNQSAPITISNEEFTHHDQARRTTSIGNGSTPITVTNEQLMHVVELKLMFAPESPNLVEMVWKRKMERLRLYIYPECHKAESLTPCSGCLLPHQCVLRPILSTVALLSNANTGIR